MNYYEILGVSPFDSITKIKKEYKKLCKKYHPDLHPGDIQNEEHFKLINEAYDTLSNNIKRKEYDLKNNISSSNNVYYTEENIDFNKFFDIYKNTSLKEKIIEQTNIKDENSLNIYIEVKINNDSPEVIETPTFIKNIKCYNCEGKGYNTNPNKYICRKCKGEGKIKTANSFLKFNSKITCPICRGKELLFEDPCLICNGTGYTQEEKTLKIEKNKLLRNEILIIPNEGNYQDGKIGDIVIKTIRLTT